ncbi:DUF3152 domain-containing protein [Planosporangium mesophilum]|uniref:DUF3152 domain-containing protein n=1 Tax=Planosporangium mesophilum TaxID=689768 RepID=A0A8J3X409_9ACTN|nr:DUF3152 domain-containing protein [Planosporangium mesophilum]NJC86475.1 DUF3152 domain-containing protein [Planosporangium mesophilum]GII26104.1 hypothetical protein Pme01_57010 [Planosporangium mesophilum]
MTDPEPAPDPEGDGRTPAVPPQSGHFDTRTSGGSNKSGRYKQGSRLPRDRKATRRRPTSPDPEPEPADETGPTDETGPIDETGPADKTDSIDEPAAEQTTEPATEPTDGPDEPAAEAASDPADPATEEPAAAGGRGRSAVIVGVVLLLVAAGLGGSIWGSGLLNRSSGRPTVQSRLPARPIPTLAGAAGARPSPSLALAPAIVDRGAGTFTEVQSAGPVLGTAGVLRPFRVAVEDGINENPNAFAAVVDQVLGDPRSWIASGQFRLQRVPASAPAEFTVFLASPTTSEAMCAVGGLSTDKFTSCRLPGQVIVNDARWLTAIPDYGAPLEVYRAYAVNHEVGHQLGYGHEACVQPGQPAPVMQQQTYGLNGCLANSWPYLGGQRYAGPSVP